MKIHNIHNMFNTINSEYYGGKIKATIRYGSGSSIKKGQRGIRYGSYNDRTKKITIHPVLSSLDVPAYVVEWVIHHEILHQVHPPYYENGKRLVHYKAFKDAERKTPKYKESKHWLIQYLKTESK